MYPSFMYYYDQELLLQLQSKNGNAFILSILIKLIFVKKKPQRNHKPIYIHIEEGVSAAGEDIFWSWVYYMLLWTCIVGVL